MTSSTPSDLNSAPQDSPAPPQPGATPQPAQPAMPQWAAQRRVWRTVETEPLEYHRLLRGTAGYRWWKPLLLLLLSGVYFGVFTVVVGFASIPLMMWLDPSYLNDIAAGTGEILDTQRPVSVFVSLVSIIVMIPAVMLAMLSMGMRPVGRIWSVAGRMRWGLFGKLMGVAVASVVVMNLVGIVAGLVLDPATASAPLASQDDSFSWQLAGISMLLVLLLVPFQAAAEEVVFRGLFMQVLGSWVKNPWLAILLPTLGFAAAHIYDMWGLAAVGLMGGVAAWLSWRTGGLEAAIAIHIVNNLIAFGFMAAGLAGSTAQTESSGGAGTLIGEIAGLGTFIWLTLIVFRRGGYGRQRIDLVNIEMPAAPAGAAPMAAPAAPIAAPAAPVAPVATPTPEVGTETTPENGSSHA
ncbi:membrane protease YdiL (CAAX protease family) [Leucobacter exalbidus]|uniref:Membrane protease YdiL (CAAX protease family) n=1 Tax=Leucobacter exalbidus TaxID=662960 RepID=A0A940PWZ3_9MICO|nr:CPBP family glutamic-type intramembrane protease [Leucobacter exalbidus]MBP1326661.1 membrane protease YdiL (CAAX protease family) [Leucobacter exalbidus]